MVVQNISHLKRERVYNLKQVLLKIVLFGENTKIHFFLLPSCAFK